MLLCGLWLTQHHFKQHPKSVHYTFSEVGSSFNVWYSFGWNESHVYSRLKTFVIRGLTLRTAEHFPSGFFHLQEQNNFVLSHKLKAAAGYESYYSTEKWRKTNNKLCSGWTAEFNIIYIMHYIFQIYNIYEHNIFILYI